MVHFISKYFPRIGVVWHNRTKKDCLRIIGKNGNLLSLHEYKRSIIIS